MKISLSDRFWSKVDKSPGHGPNGDCWVWTGCARGKFGSGYGGIKIGRKMFFTHRVGYELQIGPIPKGLWVLHKCDNPKCVKGDHLFLGTHTDNMKDMYQKGRGLKVQGENSPNSKLTDQKVREIRQKVKEGQTHRSLAKEYEVNRRLIYDVIHYKTWKHVI